MPDDPSPIVQVDVAVLMFIIGSVIPFITALVTKSAASSGTKALVALVLSVVGGVVTNLVENGGEGSVLQIASVAIGVYLSAQAVYLGTRNNAVGAVADKTAGVGLG